MSDHDQQIRAEERERCAKLLELRPDEIRLLGGEFTAQEMRSIIAILQNRAAEIRRELPASARSTVTD